MSEHSKKYSGIKIAQQPGGTSSFSLDWGHKEEPVKKTVINQEPSKDLNQHEKNPEKQTQNEKKVIEQAGQVKKTNGVKIINPPGGKSNFTFG